MDNETTVNKKSKLTKKDVDRAFLTWHITSHLTYNYQRMQAGAMATVMGPILDKLYPNNKQKIAEGLQRQMVFFNTEPRWGAVIPGITVALEEGYANNPDTIDPNTITDTKTALMGPLAGIGDTITQALIKPLILSIFLGWAIQGHVWAALAWGIVMFTYDFLVTKFSFVRGYKLGLNSIDKLLDEGFVSKVTTFLGIVGLFSLGAMVVKFVSIAPIYNTVLSTGSKFSLADVFDKILPKLLPLIVTLFAWRLQVKGKSASFVLLMLFIIGFIGGALGIIG
ncbi:MULTISPECIES: PTS system mannose/fructose/sorbose family transporter subunit IID [Tissierellales]|jgi:PTS system mannose-specific IID component|uniref:PTS system mannose/fructose/sorbose family transporter subunit IID n=1 Tax=Acidilutibacter cellobiosedens TaxID=2507161 RepID=A0A410QE37_9FIRM|nr:MULTISPECIES: PTS system mannose/fructose/sorbose family transporter subunit IID [Tissierellales]QAT62245.1 PTS system mannose/fructose/sorbose family transporter subunit IID [Acidilutibacter cellobiosedens]SCL94749.1 PTS system mannose-specific EIID component [Sporanaerobacter sp. PP17-6a]